VAFRDYRGESNLVSARELNAGYDHVQRFSWALAQYHDWLSRPRYGGTTNSPMLYDRLCL